MSELRQRMIADMTAAGFSASTKEVYVQGVRGLAAYYRRSPDQLSEVEVRSYLLHLREPIEVTLAVLSWKYPRSLDTRSQVFPHWVFVMCVCESQSARHIASQSSGARWLMG